MKKNNEYIVRFTKEEIDDMLMNFDQCESEGYISYGDPAYSAMNKLMEIIPDIIKDESE